MADFLLYISPEYVFLPEDDLTSLTYEIKTQGRVEDESVLATRTTAASEGADFISNIAPRRTAEGLYC